jgi:LacI family transcriptional regulator
MLPKVNVRTEPLGMKKARLKDIAEKTGYTVNTVSRAINGKQDINEQTKNRILTIARELGYRPNRLARSLRLKKTKTIGVVIADVANPFFSTIIKHIEYESKLRNYSIILRDTDENQAREEEAISQLAADPVDGLIIVPVQTSSASLVRLRSFNLPFVLVGRYFEALDCDYIVTDDEEGGYIATRHLIERGHRRIAFINGPPHISSARERLKGYRRAMGEYGIPVAEGWVRNDVISLEDGYRVCSELLAVSEFPSAIFAYSDYVAVGIIRALYEHGKTPGKDISLIGYDDIDYALCFERPLTTIRIPKRELAAGAVRILCDRIEASGAGSPRQEKLKVSLIERATVGSPQ